MATLTEPALADNARKSGRPRDEARETAILEAALMLVSEVGYDRVTMDGIASRAHSSKATIYRRWGSKGALVATAVRCRAGEHSPVPDTGSLRGDLLATLEVMSQRIGEEDLGLLTGIFAAMRTDPDLAEAIREQMFADKLCMTTPMFDRAAARGEALRSDGAQLFLEIAPPMIIHRLMIASEPIDNTFVEHVVDDVLLPVFTHHAPQNRKEIPA